MDLIHLCPYFDEMVRNRCSAGLNRDVRSGAIPLGKHVAS